MPWGVVSALLACPMLASMEIEALKPPADGRLNTPENLTHSMTHFMTHSMT